MWKNYFSKLLSFTCLACLLTGLALVGSTQITNAQCPGGISVDCANPFVDDFSAAGVPGWTVNGTNGTGPPVWSIDTDRTGSTNTGPTGGSDIAACGVGNGSQGTVGDLNGLGPGGGVIGNQYLFLETSGGNNGRCWVSFFSLF